MINRSAVVVRYAQPFLDWAATLEGPTVQPALDDEPTVYLVPPFDDEEEGLEVLEIAYPLLFERELDNWYTDESCWPADRDLAMFRAWFRIEMFPVLMDICEGAIGEETPPEA